VAVRVLESPIIAVGIVSLLSVLTLRQEAADSDPATLVIADRWSPSTPGRSCSVPGSLPASRTV
jgi:hypothetical protein